jgi:hypothetical protein
MRYPIEHGGSETGGGSPLANELPEDAGAERRVRLSDLEAGDVRGGVGTTDGSGDSGGTDTADDASTLLDDGVVVMRKRPGRVK